nr:FdtA/QdtA family cupin domain-containing protein [Algoriphagus oliviformis]
MIDIPGNISDTGSVHFWENTGLFPDGIRRCFWISGVKAGESRGNHAHWQEAQVLVALSGRLDVKLEGLDGSKTELVLEGAGKGIFVPPLNWVEIRFSGDAVLLGLGDHAFLEEDFIRDKGYFGDLQKGNN